MATSQIISFNPTVSRSPKQPLSISKSTSLHLGSSGTYLRSSCLPKEWIWKRRGEEGEGEGQSKSTERSDPSNLMLGDVTTGLDFRHRATSCTPIIQLHPTGNVCVSDQSFPTIKISFAELVTKSNLERSAIVSSITRGSPMRTKVTRLRSCDSFVAPACRPLLVAPALKIFRYINGKFSKTKDRTFFHFSFHFHERFREITSYQCLTKHHILHSPHHAEVTCDWCHVWEIRHSARGREKEKEKETNRECAQEQEEQANKRQ